MKPVQFRVGDRILRGVVRNANKLCDKYTMVTALDGRHYLVEDSEFIGDENDERKEEICTERQDVQEAPARKRGRPKKHVG